MKRILLLSLSYIVVGFIGFAAGIYFLPILTAPEAPSTAQVEASAERSKFSGEFRRDLEDSDALHWGEGTLFVGPTSIALQGEVAPGPAYKLYLSPEFVETEARFAELKSQMALVGDVKTFKNFVVSVPEHVDPSAYSTAIIWCESFSQFITAARYQ